MHSTTVAMMNPGNKTKLPENCTAMRSFFPDVVGMTHNDNFFTEALIPCENAREKNLFINNDKVSPIYNIYSTPTTCGTRTYSTPTTYGTRTYSTPTTYGTRTTYTLLSNMIKSPTHRSYYAYDGSASSCDGDDHLPNQFHQQPERKFSSSEFHLDDRCRVNNTMSSESKMQNAMNFSTLPGRRHHATEGSNWSHDKWHLSRKRGHASGSRMILDKDDQTTAFPFISTGSHTGHKHGNPSNYRNNLAHNSSLHPSEFPQIQNQTKQNC